MKFQNDAACRKPVIWVSAKHAFLAGTGKFYVYGSFTGSDEPVVRSYALGGGVGTTG